ncbi:MAG: 1,4-dihydroxy-6-naphthoate synthase [Vulcanimicrobiaceae bacterium]
MIETATSTLAYSPCPNDTYIFAALTNGLLEQAPSVRVHFADIEELNNAALRGTFELTKVSYGAIPWLMERYRILRAGGALGRGCGPLVVTGPGRARSLEELRDAVFAIPGERTTAFMLLQLALGARPRTVQLRFDRIIPAIAAGEVEAGLIIHESRFTYADAGLVRAADLGEWWERTTGKPIPLGAILVRNDIARERALGLNRAIERSLAFARHHENLIMPFIREHAFEMSEAVMRDHIALYVNDYSRDIGEGGILAVRELFARARDAGILPVSTEPAFV